MCLLQVLPHELLSAAQAGRHVLFLRQHLLLTRKALLPLRKVHSPHELLALQDRVLRQHGSLSQASHTVQFRQEPGCPRQAWIVCYTTCSARAGLQAVYHTLLYRRGCHTSSTPIVQQARAISAIHRQNSSNAQGPSLQQAKHAVPGHHAPTHLLFMPNVTVAPPGNAGLLCSLVCPAGIQGASCSHPTTKHKRRTVFCVCMQETRMHACIAAAMHVLAIVLTSQPLLHGVLCKLPHAGSDQACNHIYTVWGWHGELLHGEMLPSCTIGCRPGWPVVVVAAVGP